MKVMSARFAPDHQHDDKRQTTLELTEKSVGNALRRFRHLEMMTTRAPAWYLDNVGRRGQMPNEAQVRSR
ncbi:hypothetical protein A8V01_22955 [Novosphingobium guangzhouense]|uniref:Uncharacterized protein n=1 Tax=Novosphingobium guangzhouense TaxID=1850347 RepID=A0A2K2FXX4_9SPHN|nr:hypothetical protein A8V01_22955 [Novosphingobium guangzhouense]